MKKFYTYFFTATFWLGALMPALAQTPVDIGGVADVTAIYKAKARAKARNASGDDIKIRHAVPGQGNIVLTINGSKKQGSTDVFFGQADNDNNNNHFFFEASGNKLSGYILLKDRKKAYKYSSSNKGRAFLEEVDIDEVICVEYPQEISATNFSGGQTGTVMAAAPDLQSFPGATAVVLLDFNGQYVDSPYWNGGSPINAAPANLSEAAIMEVWKMISEDFRPFALNITTNESVYLNAPVNRRMRVIFTPTNFYNSGGVAHIGSFTWDTETPCWVFMFPDVPASNSAEAGSHEIGHTLGLGHDGRVSPSEEYYLGQNLWAPIMGTGYNKQVVQWSKGEYVSANNLEDDLYMITTQNGFGYRSDDHSNSTTNATPLVKDALGTVSASQNEGIITNRSDVDVFTFTSANNNVSLTVNPGAVSPNLDILLTLKNSAGQTMLTTDPPSLSASINQYLPSGTYYLYIDGAKGGYGANSDYSSLGEYSITGTITPANPSPVVSLTSPSNGASFTAPASVAIAATATDADGVSKVEFYNGTTKLGEDLTSPYSYSWTSVGAGTYSLTAKAIDSKGATGTSAAVSITVSSSVIACTASGSISREFWGNVTGISVASIPLTATPASKTTLTSFETTSNSGDNYGQRIRGYLCAPTTGSYIFYIASDDSGELWLSTDDNPLNKRKIASVNSVWAGPRDWTKYPSQKSVAITLTAARRYYIEALHKEGAGGDNLAVGWTPPSTSTIVVIPGSRLSPFTTSPTSNSSPVVSLTSPSNGASFTAPASVAIAATATDADGVSKVEFYNGTTKLGEDLTSPYSYSWTSVGAGTYSLTAKAIDSKGATGSSTAVSITVGGTNIACAGTGTITREYWANITGSLISSIPLTTTPTSKTTLTSFETTSNSGDNYGQRIRGYICVPTTGSYFFYIAADSKADLYLSPDADPAKKTRVAYAADFTGVREWGKYPAQKSVPISLVAGRKYYIEALHKEGSGSDNLAVGWTPPNTSTVVVIPGARLSPFSTSTARLAADEEPAEEISLKAMPNPFSTSALVEFSNTLSGEVTLDLYDTKGILIKGLFKGEILQGIDYQIPVDGSALTSGLYYVRMRTSNKSAYLKLILTK